MESFTFSQRKKNGVGWEFSEDFSRFSLIFSILSCHLQLSEDTSWCFLMRPSRFSMINGKKKSWTFQNMVRRGHTNMWSYQHQLKHCGEVSYQWQQQRSKCDGRRSAGRIDYHATCVGTIFHHWFSSLVGWEHVLVGQMWGECQSFRAFYAGTSCR